MKFSLNKNVKFILKCLICLLPLIAFMAFVNFAPMYFMDEEYPSWRYLKEVTKGEVGEEYYETVILGDSVAKSSLIPEMLSDGKCINLAVGGATPIDMYYAFSDYLENHEAPKNVIILFGPFHYWHVDNYKTRTVYFKSLDIKDALDLYKNADLFEAEAICFEGYKLYEASCRLGLPTVYLPAINAAHFAGRYDTNKALYDKIKSQNGYSVFGDKEYCDDVSYEASYKMIEDTGANEILLVYMEGLINLANQNGCKASCLHSALNETTYDSMNDTYLGQYYTIVEKMAEFGENVYCDEKLRRYPCEYFGDASHLNEKGAVKYTAEIDEILKQLE